MRQIRRKRPPHGAWGTSCDVMVEEEARRSRRYDVVERGGRRKRLPYGTLSATGAKK